MTYRDLFRQVKEMFEAAGMEDAAREAYLFMTAMAGERVLLENGVVSREESSRIVSSAERRAAGCPLAYLKGRKEFMSLDLVVNPAVLIPRPETEILVEAAERIIHAVGGERRISLLDVGTGSGNISVALAKRNPKVTVVATDVSMDALRVAEANARMHGVADRVRFVCTDLFDAFEPSISSWHIIVSNPPYVAEEEMDMLPVEIKLHEPAAALYGGKDGMDIIRRIVARAGEFLERGGYLLLEVGWGQEAAVRSLLDDTPMSCVEVVADLAGIPRVIVARKEVA